MEQLIGQRVCNRYHIQSLLGRQVGRSTFLATDLNTQTAVVLKILLFGPDFIWEDLKLFEREAETLKSLAHQAIPQYLDFFELETKLGRGFVLVQSYIKGKSLQYWIQSGRTVSEQELQAIATQLLEILDYLHYRQPSVVHRDIKPSNILLRDCSSNRSVQVYLVDFGSVQTVVDGGTVTIVGTYGYMPPEQFSGQTSPASDLYALGATLIYVATGRHPNELPHKKMRVCFSEKVNLNLNLVDWLQRMTEPNLELRFKSAKQALKALKNSNLRERTRSSADKSSYSKVKVTSTRQISEILIPLRFSRGDLIRMVVLANIALHLIFMAVGIKTLIAIFLISCYSYFLFSLLLDKNSFQ